MEYYQPMHIVIFRRRENYSPGWPVPGARGRSVEYVGKVNGPSDTNPNGTFFGDAARMWLCTKMDGYSDDK
ncbi:MAG: hypothetical protein ACYTEX_26955 [Planctomycetota bacterium]